jgi:type-F conjugative transfer system pilin assembly protein TrbC
LEEKKLLRPLIFPFFLFFISVLEARSACSQTMSCSSCLQEGSLSERSLIESSLKIVETIQKDKDFQSFLSESFKQKDGVLESKEFQDVVETLKASSLSTQIPTEITKNKPAELTLFVSFSMGEKALLNLVQEAKLYGATLVLRGFKDGSYAKTVKALQNIIQKTGQGFIIDPELFSLFSIPAVPTCVLSKPFQLQAQTQERTFTPLHYRLQGHVSLLYALEMFAKEGDLKEEANSILENTRLERGRSK